jgi:hypothetical protein
MRLGEEERAMDELIKSANDSETWKRTRDTRTSFIKISFSDDLDSVIVATADHKSPWVSDGEQHESFEAARRAHGLPAVGPVTAAPDWSRPRSMG